MVFMAIVSGTFWNAVPKGRGHVGEAKLIQLNEWQNVVPKRHDQVLLPIL